jgi:hypothetical protein
LIRGGVGNDLKCRKLNPKHIPVKATPLWMLALPVVFGVATVRPFTPGAWRMRLLAFQVKTLAAGLSINLPQRHQSQLIV